MKFNEITENGVYKYTTTKSPMVFIIIVSGPFPFFSINGIFDIKDGKKLSDDCLRGITDYTLEKINL
jgi:hypothetical protein